MTNCEAEGQDYVVLLQGKLVAGGIIEGAGLTVQVKKAKPAAVAD